MFDVVRHNQMNGTRDEANHKKKPQQQLVAIAQ